MSGLAIFRQGIWVAGLMMAAAGVAQAKIPQSQQAIPVIPDVAGPGSASGYVKHCPVVPAPGDSIVTETITLNFGPLHFQEITKTARKTCLS